MVIYYNPKKNIFVSIFIDFIILYIYIAWEKFQNEARGRTL